MSQTPFIPPTAVASGIPADTDESDDTEKVGAADAAEDARRSGADADATFGDDKEMSQDHDGAAVGRSDAEEDARRSGADPSEV